MEASIININDIISFEEIPMEDTYDLTVEDNSNYYLATQCMPILVHNSGKSTWARWYLTQFVHHNEKENIKFALFTPENRPVSREMAKIAEVITGQFYRRGWKNSMSDQLRNKTMRFIEKHFFFISPNKLNFETWDGKIDANRVNTMESLLQYLIYLKKTENIFGFVVDAWNKIEHEQPKNITETTFISQQLDYLINFCDVWDVHGMLIAHPTKIEQTGLNYKMPNLYSIKGSSAWKEKPDIGIILHRNMNKKIDDVPRDADDDDKYEIDENAPTILRTEKIRFEEIGKMGRVKLSMDYSKGGRFSIYKEAKPKPVEGSPIDGKLNPSVKKEEEDDEVFNNNGSNGNTTDMSDLPF